MNYGLVEIAKDTNFQVPAHLAALIPSVALSEESCCCQKTRTIGRINVLEQRLAQSEQDALAGEVSAESAERTMRLIEEEIAVVEPLVKENSTCNAPFSTAAGIRANLGVKQSGLVSIGQAELSIGELQREITNSSGLYSAAMDELSEVAKELNCELFRGWKIEFRAHLFAHHGWDC